MHSYEEEFVAGMDIPALQCEVHGTILILPLTQICLFSAVGYEGLFGFLTLGSLLVPFYYIPVGPPFSDNATGSLENVIDALYQIKNSWQIMVAIGGTVVSIAFFNFAGISVTKVSYHRLWL